MMNICICQYSSELSGRHYVSMVLKYCLPKDAFYTLGHMVDHGCDTPIESFVVHSPFLEQVEPSCEGRLLAVTNDHIRPPIIIQNRRNKHILTHMHILLT